jgi:hypothetical protein
MILAAAIACVVLVSSRRPSSIRPPVQITRSNSGTGTLPKAINWRLPGMGPLATPSVGAARVCNVAGSRPSTMSQNLKAAEGNVPHCTQPRSCGHVAAPKTDTCPAHFSQATRCRAAGHQSAGGRHPEICRRQVCARCHRKKKDVQAISLLWRQARVCVWPDALFGRVQATRPCHTHLPCRHHERASSNRKATSDLRCHASQNDPQTHSRGSLTHPAHKIGGIPAADSPSITRRRSGLSSNADNPSCDVPNDRQPSSDTGSDTRAALQKRARPITAGASAQVGEAREPTAPQMGQINVPER